MRDPSCLRDLLREQNEIREKQERGKESLGGREARRRVVCIKMQRLPALEEVLTIPFANVEMRVRINKRKTLRLTTILDGQ